ncbi:hypothetical protein BS78_03G183000 [Paspalum vaginatum]|nr:hypothetical protein BS78_03G183000 [Paspalum vaginatum]
MSKETKNSSHMCDCGEDVLYTIASKLPPKESARTSILSSVWRCLWLWPNSMCPRLTFDAVEICKCGRDDMHKHMSRFISEVYRVLWLQHGDKVVETLKVRFDFVDDDNQLLLDQHIDNWVSIAVSLGTKNLNLDLKPRKWWNHNAPYAFPFHLLDWQSMSYLQHMQLSYVSLGRPPPHFKGFPNLRKLHLRTPHMSSKDLQHVLSRCCNLEWLHLDRCDLHGEQLMMSSPLPRLLYLKASYCKLTRLEFNAVNLVTFKYTGYFAHIRLVHSSKLQGVNIKFFDVAVFRDALASPLNGIPSVQSLTLWLDNLLRKKQWFWDNPLKFSNLKHLQLLLLISPKEADKILYSSASVLRVTPFIKMLEVHYNAMKIWLSEEGLRREDLVPYKYNYLKNIWITGFEGERAARISFARRRKCARAQVPQSRHRPIPTSSKRFVIWRQTTLRDES